MHHYFFVIMIDNCLNSGLITFDPFRNFKICSIWIQIQKVVDEFFRYSNQVLNLNNAH